MPASGTPLRLPPQNLQGTTEPDDRRRGDGTARKAAGSLLDDSRRGFRLKVANMATLQILAIFYKHMAIFREAWQSSKVAKISEGGQDCQRW